MVYIPTLEGVSEGDVWATVLKDETLGEPSDEEMRQRLDFRVLDKKYESVGKCIYCLSDRYSSSRHHLGLEHIIPESIGGHLRLPLASCEECERRINTVETFVAKQMLEVLRYKLGIRGKPGKKRSKKRRMSERVAFWTCGQARTFDVPLSMVPYRALLPTPPIPGILKDKNLTRSNVLRYSFFDLFKEEEIERLKSVYSATAIRIRVGKIATEPYMRFCAKIAHSFAVAELGLARFKPLLIPFILGNSEHGGSFLVGTSSRIWTSSKRHVIVLTSEEYGGLNYWVCRLQIFADLGFPEYILFVGIDSDSDKKPLPEMRHDGWGIYDDELASAANYARGHNIFMNPGNNESPQQVFTFGSEEHRFDLDRLLVKDGSRPFLELTRLT